jgi:hypothetical protein
MLRPPQMLGKNATTAFDFVAPGFQPGTLLGF